MERYGYPLYLSRWDDKVATAKARLNLPTAVTFAESLNVADDSNQTPPGSNSPTATASVAVDASKPKDPAKFFHYLRLRSQEVLRDTNAYLILLAAFIGAVTALGAVGFMWLMEFIQEIFLRWPATWSGNADAGIPLWVLIVGPAIGAAICGAIVYYGAPEAKGHGVPEVMVALYRNKAQIRPRVAVFKSLASAFTIGSGGSAGAEGPIVQIGSAIGSAAGRLLGISQHHRGTLLGCGAAAGIASVFNAPIAGIFFVLEILLRDFSIRTFTPIVIASVFSSAVTRACHGDSSAIFEVPGGHSFTVLELPYYLVLGLMCGAVAVAFTKALDFMEEFYDRLKLHGLLQPISGALIVGFSTVILIQVFGSVPSVGDNLPAYFGNGYAFIQDCLTVDYYDNQSNIFWIILLLLALGFLKVFATCCILGSGGSGGIFAPSLFLGATVGGAFGILAAFIDPFGLGAVSPAAYALVGMAAVVAGTTHAPLTAILILFEITGDYKVILPVMLAAVLATIVAQFILRDSIYTIKVRRSGIKIGCMSDLTVLRRISVSDVALVQPLIVHPEESAARLVELADRHNAEDFVVADENACYLGMVTGTDLRTTLLQMEALPLLVVDELKRADLPTTTPDETLDVVMDKFSRTDAANLVVLTNEGDGKVIGMISRSGMMRQYHRALDSP